MKVTKIDINKMNSSLFEEHDQINKDIVTKIKGNLD